LIPPGYNPFQKLRTGAGRHRKRLFTWEDARHCVATADRLEMPSIGTALVLAFAGVMRITDAVALEARHVANGRLVYAQSKTGAEIDAALPSVIALRLAAAPPPATRCAALCVSEQTGKPWHEKTISRVWSRVILPAAIKANPEKWRHLEGLQLRDARRSGFTWLLEKGYKVEGIVPLSGHSIQEGYEIAKHYAVNTRTRSDHASAGMDMAL
jgi:hypothetical protein